MLFLWWQQANGVACWPSREEVISRCSSVKPRCGTAVVVKLHVHKVCRPKFSSFADGKQLTPPCTSNRRPQRQPLTKEERAEAEKALAAAAAAGTGDGTGAGGGAENTDPQQALGEAGEAGPELIEPANFFKEFDAWVDGKYPGDRGSATKVKVAFRKVSFAFLSDSSRKGKGIVVLRDLQAFF